MKKYRHSHDGPGGYATNESYFPDSMPEVKFYQPMTQGSESKILDRLAHLRELIKNKKEWDLLR